MRQWHVVNGYRSSGRVLLIARPFGRVVTKCGQMIVQPFGCAAERSCGQLNAAKVPVAEVNNRENSAMWNLATFDRFSTGKMLNVGVYFSLC